MPQREKRDIGTSDNILTTEFVVSPDGQDTADCLTYDTSSVSCQTITFIIMNRCEENTHLFIKLKGNKNLTIDEQCSGSLLAENASNPSNINVDINATYPCYVSLFGEDFPDTPQLGINQKDIGAKFYDVCNNATNSTEGEVCDTTESTLSPNCMDGTNTTHEVCQNFTRPVCTSILSYFLTFSPGTIDKCQTIDNIVAECNFIKLRINNVNIKGFNTEYRGNHITIAQNVNFEDFYIHSVANLESSCYFICEKCTLLHTGKYNHLTLAPNTDYNYMFESCFSTTLKLLNTTVSSVKMYSSFLSGAVATVDGVTMTRPVMSSVCVLCSVFAFCVLRHVRRKKNVRRHGKQGIQ